MIGLNPPLRSLGKPADSLFSSGSLRLIDWFLASPRTAGGMLRSVGTDRTQHPMPYDISSLTRPDNPMHTSVSPKCLPITRVGHCQVMAHRHRHPEDGAFFRRLKNLFVVHEQKPTRPVPSASKIAENTAPSSTESAPIAYMGADDSCLVATLVSPQGCERARGRRLDSMTPSTIAAGLELQAGSHGGGTEGGGGPNGRALGGTDVKVFLIWPR